jgi:hypothetical protein
MADTVNSANGTSSADETEMVFLDLGSKKKKDIKRLRKGRGKLMTRIQDTVEQLKANKEIADSSPVVVVVVKQKKSRGFLFG